MKKRLILLMLALSVVLLSSCGGVVMKSMSRPPSLEGKDVYHATVEYGEPDLITDNTGPMFAYIRFPVAGDATDRVIKKWADDLFQDAREQLEVMRKSDPAAEGEINVHFDSYLVDGKYAGILENGMYTTSQLAHPVSVIRTFNIDTDKGVFLNNTDILDYTNLAFILALLEQRITQEYAEAADWVKEMDERWLQHIALTPEGVAVLLERGAFLPSYLGVPRLTLSYDELGSAYLLGAVPGSSPVESGSPNQTTIPEPNAPAPTSPNTPANNNNIDPTKPMVALTFDDGPSQYTLQILDTLAQHGARATFCVIGNLVEARKDTIKLASDLGNEIIGHSWSHRDLTKLPSQEIIDELQDTAAIIRMVTGVAPKMHRTPYGAVNNIIKYLSYEMGYSLINWSLDTQDWSDRDADSVYTAIMTNVEDRAIILCHDLYGSTADAMERVIPELIAQGYQLVTVSELMQYSGKELEAGVVYTNGDPDDL